MLIWIISAARESEANIPGGVFCVGLKTDLLRKYFEPTLISKILRSRIVNNTAGMCRILCGPDTF